MGSHVCSWRGVHILVSGSCKHSLCVESHFHSSALPQRPSDEGNLGAVMKGSSRVLCRVIATETPTQAGMVGMKLWMACITAKTGAGPIRTGIFVTSGVPARFPDPPGP